MAGKKKSEKLSSKLVWKKGQKVWIDHDPMVAKRLNDYIATREHPTLADLDPAAQGKRWGNEGASTA